MAICAMKSRLAGRTFVLLMGVFWLFLPLLAASEPLKSLDEVVAALPHHDVSGRILNVTGDPVADAEVFLYYARGQNGIRDRLAGKTSTDSNGVYLLKKALVWEPIVGKKRIRDQQKYAVVAQHSQYGMYFRQLLEKDSTTGVDITLLGLDFGNKKTTRLRKIRVVDNNGQPVEGAKVYPFNAKLASKDRKKTARDYHYMMLYKDVGLPSGITDASGVVRLMRLPNAAFYAEKDGYARACTYGRKLVLYPGTQVKGKATYPDGSPAVGVGVSFSYDGNRLVCNDTTMTDENGCYQFKHLPASGFTYSWLKPNNQKGHQGMGKLKVIDLRPGTPLVHKKISFPLNPGDNLTKNLVLTRGVEISGKVVDLVSSKLVPNMRVNCYTSIEGGQYLDTAELKTDAKGLFRIIVAPGDEVHFQWEDSREGDYIIDETWKQDNNYQPFKRQKVNKDMTDLVLKVKLWQINVLQGRVVNEAGEGVGKATVYINSEVPGVKSDADGCFTLKTAPADRDFDLFATTEKKKLAGLISLKAGCTKVTIKMKPTKSYKGEATTPDGFPASDLNFYLDLKLNDSTLYRVRTEPKANAEGKFTARNLCPDAKYYAWWSSDNETNRDYDYGNADVDLAALEEGELIRFEAKQYINAILGEIVDTNGKAIGDAKVKMAYGRRPQNIRNKAIKVGMNGEFAIERLVAGLATLSISAPGYRSHSFTCSSDCADFRAVLKSTTEAGSICCNVSVSDAAGNPVPGAPMKLWLIFSGKVEPPTKEIEAITDTQGTASFKYEIPKGFTTGSGIVGCDLPGYNLKHIRIPLNEDVDVNTVLHRPAERWRGKVVDAAGLPIAGATVRITGMSPGLGQVLQAYPSLRDADYLIYRTDREGCYELSRVGRGTFVSMGISAPGYVRKDIDLNSTLNQGEPVQLFTLEPGGILRGKVVAVYGDNLPTHVQVTAEPVDRRNRYRREIVDRAGGGFEISGLMPGVYKIKAHSMRDRTFICKQVVMATITAGRTARITVALEKGTPVTGRLVAKADGQSLKSIKSVVARRVGSEEYDAGCMLERDGGWVMHLPVGEFELLYFTFGRSQPSKPFKKIEVIKGKPITGIVIEVDSQAK
jgi:hypothetical protein